MWVLRFDNGVTSAGVAVTDRLAAELRLADGEPAWHRLLARYPTIATQFADARPIREFTWMPRLAWRSATAAGDRWALLPSAAAFVDPLFSTGIPLTLLGVERLARDIVGRDHSRATAEYAHTTLSGSGPRGALYRRLLCGVPSLRDVRRLVDVLLCRRQFQRDVPSPARRHMVARVPAVAGRTVGGRDGRVVAEGRQVGLYGSRGSSVAAAIEPVNVAGLADPAKRNWYGVDVEDAVRAARKLGASASAIRHLFRCPKCTHNGHGGIDGHDVKRIVVIVFLRRRVRRVISCDRDHSWLRTKSNSAVTYGRLTPARWPIASCVDSSRKSTFSESFTANTVSESRYSPLLSKMWVTSG